MAGLEPDISSYNQPLPVSPLDIAGKLGSLQQQNQQIQSGAIQIDKQKLDLMNTQFGLMNAELSGMIDNPNITKEQAAARLNNFADTYKLPKEARDHMMGELQAAPSVKAFSENALRRGMTTQERLNQQYGTTESQADGTQVYQGVRAPAAKGGGFTPSTQMPVQIPPGTVGFDQNNQQQFVPPAGPSGVVPVPRPRLPVEPMPRPTTGATGPTVDRTPETPTTFANRSAPLTAGPSPLFGEGKEAYTKDQLASSARAQSIKPAIQALNMMHNISTGPGTEKITDLMALGKALGLVDIKESDDPTVIRQEINKKLAQYVGNNPNVSRSDAGQALAEAGSPSAKVQILPALKNLTRDAVALDRVKILQPQAFKGTDYQNYVKHQGTFPGSIDEKALTLDMLPEKERNTLVSKMVTQYKNGDAGEKKIASKFLDTLKLAKEHGIYEGM